MKTVRQKTSPAGRALRQKLSLRRKKNLQSKLLRWYLFAQRRLPWRRTREPYAIWISEVMLQQTQTVKVLEYYERFLRQFPDVQTLAASGRDEVLKARERIGYNARARNLHKAAQHVTQLLQGSFPADYDRLLQIPGIGPYTAAAVASIAFNLDRAVVDGNVERVLSRIFLITLPPKSPAARPVFRQCADDFLWRGRARDWNQALMELGALICTPKSPRCEECPAQNYCRARLELHDPALLPRRLDKAPRPHHHLAVGVIWKKQRLLIDQRPASGMLGGLWEFPGGRIAPGEPPTFALRREIRTALALAIGVDEKVMEVEHGYTHFSVTLHVYRCRHVRGVPRAHGGQAWKWVQPHELKRFAFSAAHRKIIDAILQDRKENETR